MCISAGSEDIKLPQTWDGKQMAETWLIHILHEAEPQPIDEESSGNRPFTGEQF